MHGDDEIRRLEELVADERARRVYAEAELAEGRRSAAMWRARADERAAQLEERSPRRSWRSSRKRRPRLDKTPPPTIATNAAISAAEDGPRPYHPTLRVAGWKAPGWIRSAADLVDLGEAIDQLAGSDLVVVGGPGGLQHLGDWLDWPARQPMVLWEPAPSELAEWRAHLTDRDVVVGEHPDHGAASRLDPFTVVDPRLLPDPPWLPTAGEWSVVDSETPLEAVVRAALDRRSILWQGSARPPELEGLIGDPGSDPRKAGIRARLAAARRFNPGMGLERITRPTPIDLSPADPSVGILLISRRPERVTAVLDQIARLRYPRLRTVVGLHGAGEIGNVEAYVAGLGIEESVKVVSFDERWQLGRCLNAAAEMLGTGVLAKFDDDDRYGPWYLDEAVDELTMSGADLVGKMTQFVHLSHADQLVLYQPGQENTPVGYVNGPTFVLPRKSWEEVRFPHRRARVDSVFVRGLRAVGGSIRSTSRYEFVLGRHETGHTWETSDEHFLARGEVVGDGDATDQVWLDQIG